MSGGSSSVDRGKVFREVVVRQALVSLADNFSAPYIGYYLASLSTSGILQGVLQFSTNSLPAAVQVLLGPFIDWWGRYVAILLATSICTSILWLIISLTTVPEVLVGLVTLRAILVGLTGLAFTAFVGAFFAASTRGKLLSAVNVVSQLVALLVFTLTATFINPDIGVLRVLFMSSGFVSLTASIVWARLLYIDRYIAGGRSRSGRPPNPLRSIGEVAGDRSFRKLYTAYAAYIVVMSIAWPWFPVAQKYIYNMSVSDLAVMNALSTLSTMVSQYFLMRYLDRLSTKWLIVASRAGFVIPPLFYGVAREPWQIYLSSILTGPFNAIGNVVVPLYVLNIAKKDMYASYMALMNFSQGIAAAAGSMLGGVLMDVAISSGSYEPLRQYFLAVAALRLALTAPFLRIDDIK